MKMNKGAFARYCLLIWIACAIVACQEQIVHNLQEGEANKLLTRLNSVSIEGEKIRQSDGRWAIGVGSTDVLPALDFLTAARAFNSAAIPADNALSIIATQDERQFQLERTSGRELEQTLLSLNGVLEARVHLRLPQSDPLYARSGSTVEGSAAVMIIAGEQFSIPSEQITSLVSSAYGLSKERVVVLVDRAAGMERKPRVANPPAKSWKAEGREFLINVSTNKTLLLCSAVMLTFGMFALRSVLRSREVVSAESTSGKGASLR